MVVIGDCEKGRELELDLELEIQPGMFLDKKGEERRIRIIRYDIRIEWDAALSAESRIQNIGGGDKILAGPGESAARAAAIIQMIWMEYGTNLS